MFFLLKERIISTPKKSYEKGIEGAIQLYTTPAVLHITSYWVAKAYSPKIAKQLILELLTDVAIIDCTHATVVMALHSSFDDIEDALQYYAALKYKLDFFISADKGLRKAALPQLPVCTTLELIGVLNKANNKSLTFESYKSSGVYGCANKQ